MSRIPSSTAPDAAPAPGAVPPPKRALGLTLAAAFLGWMFDGMEMGIFPLVARPALNEMLAGAGGDGAVGLWMGRVTACFLLGAAAGGLLFGWLGDKLGRVRAMALSILTYSLLTGLCYFATEPWHLAALRFLAALGMGGEWSLGVALVMETWPERHRPLLAGVIGAAANVGFVLIGAIAWWFPIAPESWRWLMLIGAVPALLTFGLRLFVPESERWQTAAARSAPRPLAELFAPGVRRATGIGIVAASIALLGTWGSVQWIPLWVDQLAGAANPSAKGVTAILIAAGAIPGCFLGAALARLGRRTGFALMCLFSFVSCALLFRGVSLYGGPLLVMAFIVGATTATFYGWLPLYLPELFPTRVRATAQGVSFNFGRVLAAAGALGSGQLVQFYNGDYARMGATITFIYLLGLVAIWIAPETRGRPLPA